MGFNPKQRHIAFTECSGSSPPPLRYHQFPHGFLTYCEGERSSFSPAERFSEIRQVQRSWTLAPTPKNLSPKDVQREDGRVGS